MYVCKKRYIIGKLNNHKLYKTVRRFKTSKKVNTMFVRVT